MAPPEFVLCARYGPRSSNVHPYTAIPYSPAPSQPRGLKDERHFPLTSLTSCPRNWLIGPGTIRLPRALGRHVTSQAHSLKKWQETL